MKIERKRSKVVRSVFYAADTILFSALLFLPLYLQFSHANRKIFAVPILIGMLGTVALLRYRKARLEKIKEENEKRMKRRIEQILLMSDSELAEKLNTDTFLLIRKSDPDRFDILEAIRSGANVIGLFRVPRETGELIARYRPEVIVYDRRRLLESVFPNEASQEADERQIPSILKRCNKYLLLGLFLLIASFLFRYKIYFRMLSALCLLLGVIVNGKNRFSSKK